MNKFAFSILLKENFICRRLASISVTASGNAAGIIKKHRLIPE